MTKTLDLKCECGGSTKIRATHSDGRGVRRKRTCSRCGHSFPTYEISGSAYRLLLDFQKVLQRHKPG